jgi:tetratricopeptide (TPR) repeat protein
MTQKFILGLALAFTFACNNNKNAVDYHALFTHSMEVKDYHTAIVAAQTLLLQDSTQSQYVDSLPELYAAVRNFGSAEYYTDMALVKKPTDEKLLQLKALCLQEAGKGMELLDFYNKLYAATGKITYLYQVATIQLSAGDAKGAQGSFATLEKEMVNSTDTVDFMISETEKQRVPLRAAVYNAKAFVAANNNDLNGAKKYFEMALKEFPDFYTAQQNYIRLMQGAKGQQR